MLTAAYDQVRTEARSNAGVAAEVIATESARTVVTMLQDAGLLLMDRPAPRQEMTAREAAELLCELSRTPRLDEPEQDAQQLLDAVTMVDYAWRSAVAAGIPPEDATRAHAAHRVLLAHHRAK